MQCVEFESRLNNLLDERLAPGIDIGLVEHAQSCAGCCELLSAHEALLEGVAAMPMVRLRDAQRQALAHRVVAGVMAEVGSAPTAPIHTEPFHAGPFLHANDARTFETSDHRNQSAVREVELAPHRPTVVATNPVAPWAVIGLVLATAAAVLIAVLPWFRGERQPAAPPGQNQLMVENDKKQPGLGDSNTLLQEYDDLALIARVGYQVADGLTPVTNSMVSALRELRKRPLFRGPDGGGRSSSYLPRDANAPVA